MKNYSGNTYFIVSLVFISTLVTTAVSWTKESSPQLSSNHGWIKEGWSNSSEINVNNNIITNDDEELNNSEESDEIESTSDEPADNPCDPYDPPVPDFSASRRRISVTKCYEYIWQTKVRIDRKDRARQCEEIKTGILQTTNKVIGGRGVAVQDFPNMGAIGWKSVDVSSGLTWSFKCGCTLISPNFVITAAHCAKASTRDTTIADVVPKIVRFGVEDIIHLQGDRLPVDRNITNIIVHPQYASPKKYFDLALMQLEKDIAFSKFVQPACLWNGPVTVFNLKEVQVTGWGVTSVGAQEGSPTLQAATLNIVDSKSCDVLLKPMCNRLWCGLQDHQFCAGKLAGGVDACQGDSGGPLQSELPIPNEEEGSMHYVVGVTSFGIGCARRDVPGVYTKLPYFLDWIESIVWK